MHTILDEAERLGTFVGRIWRAEHHGPSLVSLREGCLVDITSRRSPTMRDLLQLDEPVDYAKTTDGEVLGTIDSIAQSTLLDTAEAKSSLLAPCDLQAIKACGVTFARSMIERVIEEKAAGDPARAERIRSYVTDIIGDSLSKLEAGSDRAAQVKQALIEEGLWSQYLEVGIGPDAEVFTKSQPMSAVGYGADIGLHPVSRWSNPEPEIVLAVNGDGRIMGATLGNDVNLRDVEGRSALLLGKAKDNNASCAIGPLIRLFDDTYSLDDVRQADLDLLVQGNDDYQLKGKSSMQEISRHPVDLVSQTCGRHHQYPDGFMLFLGTLFVPVDDREVSGEGFTHKIGDIVYISNDRLGTLQNTVKYCTDCAPWQFGFSDLMRNLAKRNLL